MKPCPKCGCTYHRLAYRLDEAGTQVALACFSKACDYTGPYTGVTFPPGREDMNRAADLWDAEIFRQSLPAHLRRRLPVLNKRTAGNLH